MELPELQERVITCIKDFTGGQSFIGDEDELLQTITQEFGRYYKDLKESVCILKDVWNKLNN